MPSPASTAWKRTSTATASRSSPAPRPCTLTLTTGWGTAARKDQTVTLRLNDAKETVLVGEFEVK